MYDGEIRIDTRIDTSGVDKGLDEMQGKVSHSIKGLSAIVKGAGLASAFAAISKGISGVAKSTKALEDSIRKASTLFGDVSVDVDGLRQKMLTLSSETGIAADEIGGALYEALSSGVPVTEDMGEAMAFLESAAKAAKGGFADLTGTVTATAAVINAYGMSMEDAERVQGVLIQTQNKGMTTIGKLATGLARVIPTAASFGVSLEQIGAALATTTAAGTQTDEAITGLNSLLSELGKQGQQGAKGLSEAAKAAGLGEQSFQSLVDNGWSLGEILSLMAGYAEDTDRTLIDLFGSIEAGRTALQLTGDNAERFSENLESMYDTAGLTAAAAAKVTTNTERLGLALENAGSSVGRYFEPAVQDAAGILAEMVNSLFGNRDEAGKLKKALSDLETAARDYADAQDIARDKTDESTAAMVRQSQAAYIKALGSTAESYKELEDSVEDYEDKLSKQQKIQDNARRGILEIAEAADVSYDELHRLISIYENVEGRRESNAATQSLISLGINEEQIRNLQTWFKQVSETTVEISSLQGNLEDEAKALGKSVYQAFRMVKEGLVDIDSVRDISIDLADAVMGLGAAYESGMGNAEKAFGIIGTGEQELELYLESLKRTQSGLKEGSAEWMSYAGAIDTVSSALETLRKSSEEPTGENDDKDKRKAGGTGSADIEAEGQKAVRTIKTVQDEWNKAIGDNVRLSKLLGNGFDLVGEQIRATDKAIRELVEDFGLDESSEEVQYLSGTLAELQKMAEGSAEATDDTGQKLERTIKDVTDEWNRTIGSNVRLSEVLGDDFDLIDEQIRATDRAIKELIEDFNLDKTSADVQYLTGVLEELKKMAASGSDDASSSASSVTIPVRVELEDTPEDVIKELNEKMMDNGRLASIMGDSFNLAEADIAAMTSALERLVTEFDLTDSNEHVKNLIESLKLLGVTFEKTEEDAGDWKKNLEEWLKELSAEMEQWAKSAATSFAQSIGSGIEDLITDFMTIDEQVEELEATLADAEQEQLERNQELMEAQQAYHDALLLGNEADIESAEQNLAIADRTKKAQDEKVKSLQNEIKATKDGTKAWESFGKSALLALADVLEGLGAQLAAQAVAQAIAYNWVNAALATAGSVAAYIAAGLVRGWAGSYAEGGIVPKVAGVPSTGDRHVASVNPGELILTEAQQGNIARLLTAQEAMIDAREAESVRGAGNIVINLSGAEIIGLDSEEVGRAIYRNIRSLQVEGVIGRWS